jgi:ubiquinone/menaquinone biosynthesis C-methylase UbiE
MGTADPGTVTRQYRDPANLTARATLHERYSTNPTGLHRWLVSQMGAPPRARILELGCGFGSLWVKNLDRLSPGWAMVLTDASPGMVNEALLRLAAGRDQFTFAVVDAQALPFAAGSFEAVLAHFMLYHVPDRARAFGEVARVLRPDGVLYAATNGRQHMREATTFAVRAGLLDQDTLDTGDAVEFSLENGAAQLKPWFADIEMRRYEDALLVTEAEPLLAYILSGWDVQAELDGLGSEEAEQRVDELRALLEAELAAHGQIRVSKDSGLFVARRPRHTR